jgi:hypothetical protein
MSQCSFCGSTTNNLVTYNIRTRSLKNVSFCEKDKSSDESSCFKKCYFFTNIHDWSNGIPFSLTESEPIAAQQHKHPCGYCGSIDYVIYNSNTHKRVFKYPYFCKNDVCYRKALWYMYGIRECPPPKIITFKTPFTVFLPDNSTSTVTQSKTTTTTN